MTTPRRHARKRCGKDACDYCSCHDDGRDCLYSLLYVCSVCGGSESSLTTDCPGVLLPWDVAGRVAAGEVDYVNGAWVKAKEASKP